MRKIFLLALLAIMFVSCNENGAQKVSQNLEDYAGAWVADDDMTIINNDYKILCMYIASNSSDIYMVAELKGDFYEKLTVKAPVQLKGSVELAYYDEYISWGHSFDINGVLMDYYVSGAPHPYTGLHFQNELKVLKVNKTEMVLEEIWNGKNNKKFHLSAVDDDVFYEYWLKAID